MTQRKFTLDEKDLPTHWYNIQADLPEPLPPPIHPATGQPIGPQDLAPLFPMALIEQEVSRERWIAIPEPVREAYRLWRPTPLIRALALEKALGTPARIYYKWEGVSPAGSHKPNTATAQAYYNKQEGVRRLATETGAGQWGSALALAARMFDLECKVYMVRVSYDQKPYRRILMETWGASVVPSPSPDTNAGRAALKADPNSPGSLGLAISEAVEDAASRDDTKYSLGSVLNHVLLHQTVIGQEAKKQLELAGDRADILVGCIGGGSNFFPFPFHRRKAAGEAQGAARARRRADGRSQPHQGHLRLRLRRHRDDHAPPQDAHPRSRLHPGADPRRRAALPRHGPLGVGAVRGQGHRGRRGAP